MARHQIFLCLLALLICGGQVVYAQDQQDSLDENQSEAAQDDAAQEQSRANILELVEVVGKRGYRATTASSVTGLNVPLENLPINIQVMNSQVAADFQLVSQRDALQFHAAVNDKRVRGFSTGEFFRNGVIHLSDMPAYTIERIEIMRGPSSSLNGPVTPGGALNVISKKPISGENTGSASGYWGFSSGRDNYGGDVDLNFGQIGPDMGGGPLAAVRVVGGYQNDTGFGSRVDNTSKSILPMLQLRPTDSTIIDLEYYSYDINTDRTDRPMGIELFLPGPTAGEEIPLAIAYGIDPRSSWFGEDTDIEESLSDWSIGLSQAFGDNFLLNLRYNDHNRDFVFGPGNRPRIDLFYVMQRRSGVPATSVNPADFQLRRLTERLALLNEIQQSSANLTWLPEWGGAQDHQFNVGVNWYDQDSQLNIQRPRPVGATGGFYFDFFDPFTVATDDLRFNQAGLDLNQITVLSRDEFIDLTNYYVSYQGNFFDNRLNVLLGAYDSTIEIKRSNLLASSPTVDTIADNNETLLQVGAVYHFTDSFAMYANYSESQLPDVNDPDFAVTPPVRLGEQEEIGMRFNLFDGALLSSLSYFQIDEDLVGETARTAEADGFEIDGSWIPNDNVNVAFSYAHVSTEVTGSSNAASIGDPLPDEVPNKAAVWARYLLDEGVMSGLSFGAGLIWTDDRVRPTAAAATTVKKLNGQVLEYESETRLDVFAAYDFNNMQLSLNVRNLTKEANLSTTVPRVPLQGGLKPNGKPYVFEGEVEVMLGFRYFY